jgi:pyruvate kinase
VGKHPVDAARTMAAIAGDADAHPSFGSWEDLHETAMANDPEIVAGAAYQCALSAGVRAIAVFTITGSTARLVSRLRPSIPIYAFTPSAGTARALAVSYGVIPVLGGGEARSADDMFAEVDRVLQERCWVASGEAVVIVAGLPLGRPGSTNLLKVHRVGGGL